MKDIYLYNTLTRRKEKFESLRPGEVGIYTCGPTVYNYAHLGNLRTYIFEDVLKRMFLYNNYRVKHVMNVTDVGHLTGDRDMGEDKIEKGASKEGKTAQQIADFYFRVFLKDIKFLNILEPDIWCRATDHIKEQIVLIKKLEEKGYTYRTSDGIYFNTAKFKNYNKLSHQSLKALREGARVEKNKEKRNPTDFALWKFSPPGVKRQQEWDSPWGVGFPGWHIECSAMSMKYLGEQFDIHCGGIDHINVHHTNEIAQSEAAIGREPWVRWWLHGAFLNIAGGKKMAKSEGNFLTLKNALIKRGLNPLSFRFAALQVHYRKPMEYSEEGMRNAENSLNHLYNQARELKFNVSGNDTGQINENYKDKFLTAVNDDLNMPQALSVIQDMLKSDLKSEDKLATVLDFDRVLGLNLDSMDTEKLPAEIKKLTVAREKARTEKKYEESDRLRQEIESRGYVVEDTKEGMRVFKK
jgi:cysteinyl-tRNA synthetase